MYVRGIQQSIEHCIYLIHVYSMIFGKLVMLQHIFQSVISVIKKVKMPILQTTKSCQIFVYYCDHIQPLFQLRHSILLLSVCLVCTQKRDANSQNYRGKYLFQPACTAKKDGNFEGSGCNTHSYKSLLFLLQIRESGTISSCTKF